MSVKKGLILVSIGIIVIAIIMLLPKGDYGLVDAVVNNETGDVAFCRLDNSGKKEILKISVFNKDGELIFTKAIIANDGGVASLDFYDNNLYVYYGRVTKEIYIFDSSGARVDGIVPAEKRSSFDGWDFSYGKYTYTTGDYEYCYNEPTIFRHSASLTIKVGEVKKEIYRASQ